MVQIIGHRGWRGLYPENTIIGFQKAITLGVDAIELDVVVSGDQQIVVSHEPFMSSLTCIKPNGELITEQEHLHLNLYAMTYAEIERFDCGLKLNHKFPKQKNIECVKPLLHDVITSCESFVNRLGVKPIEYIIEVKSKPEWVGEFYPEPNEYVALLLKVLNNFNFHHQIILKSFDIHISNEIKRQAPHFKQSMLINRDEIVSNKLQLLDFKPKFLGPYFKLFQNDDVVNYQQQSFQILPWTVNMVSDMKQMIAQKVNGIITDYPKMLKELIQ